MWTESKLSCGPTKPVKQGEMKTELGEKKEEGAVELWHSSDVCWAWPAAISQPSFRFAGVYFLSSTTSVAFYWEMETSPVVSLFLLYGTVQPPLVWLVRGRLPFVAACYDDLGCVNMFWLVVCCCCCSDGTCRHGHGFWHNINKQWLDAYSRRRGVNGDELFWLGTMA